MSPMPAPCLLCLPFTATYINNCIKICALDTGTPTALGGLCSLGYRTQLACRLTWPHILMDLAQKLHFEPDLRVVGKLVLPQSAAGHEGKGQGWHVFRLCPEVVEGPTLSHPTTLGRRVPLEGTVLGEAKWMEKPMLQRPHLQPVPRFLGAGSSRTSPCTLYITSSGLGSSPGREQKSLEPRWLCSSAGWTPFAGSEQTP